MDATSGDKDSGGAGPPVMDFRFTRSACPTGKQAARSREIPCPLYGAILRGALIDPKKINL
jgi:hypothetical protein